MSNRIATTFFLGTLVVLTGGCDLGAAPRHTALAASEALAPEARYQVDAARNRVWFLNEEGVFLFEASRPGRVALALPDWVWADAHYGCLPDLALGPAGEAVITSNVLPTLWRIDPDTLAVSVHRLVLDADGDKDVGFSALVYSREHDAFYAASYGLGSLWKVDPKLVTAQKVPLSAPISQACGLAVRARSAQPQAGMRVGLCVRTPGGGRTIDFAPPRRAAYVSAAACPVGGH